MVKIAFDTSDLPKPSNWAQMFSKLGAPPTSVQAIKARVSGNLSAYGGNYVIVIAAFLLLILPFNAGLFSSLALLALPGVLFFGNTTVADEEKYYYWGVLGVVALGATYSAYECLTHASTVFLTIVALSVIAHVLIQSGGDSSSRGAAAASSKPAAPRGGGAARRKAASPAGEESSGDKKEQ
eukprot:EC691910.1.p1 GENE.EC691910.1~~EC691910.1.p1  ORF type:complete len:182 (+),score=62.79 EC691910.1:65-610(+)